MLVCYMVAQIASKAFNVVMSMHQTLVTCSQIVIKSLIHINGKLEKKQALSVLLD